MKGQNAVTVTPELYVKASDLVGRLLDLDPAGRASALGDVSRDDPEVAQVAIQLLADVDVAGGFLETSAAGLGIALFAQDPFGLIGHTLDNTYVVESLIGEGGVGAVYKAKHVTLPRHFAIKVIPASVSDKVGVEGAAGSLIHHPAVVAITDHKILPSGDAYLAMDYVEGPSLREVLEARGQLGLSEARDIVAQVADALDAAHEAGFVHRDIKPENIMIVGSGPDTGKVRIIDFGIAGYESPTRLLEDPELTGLGIGTPAYMSPEQWHHDEEENLGSISLRTDVYSLAVVFFELITGRRPVEGTVEQLRKLILAGQNHRLSEFAPELPAHVHDAVSRALSADPVGRPASAGEFVALLKGQAREQQPMRERQVVVPESLVPIERIDVRRWHGRDGATIEFYYGDLMAMPRDWGVDYLIVSSDRDDYWPVAGSLIGSLDERGVSVDRLARDKELDLRKESSCWLSRRIEGGRRTIPVKRIIGFEPEGMYTAADKIDDFFRFLRFAIDGKAKPAIVAMPLLGTGAKMGMVRNLVPPLLMRATRELETGLNVERLLVVERDDGRADDLRRELRSIDRYLPSARSREFAARDRQDPPT